MNDVMGLIYTTKDDYSLRELTASRAVAALPVVGRYRVIDFILSSMVNSGITNVGIIMQRNYHSLMDHLGAGKEWDLHRKKDGLFILPPFQTRENLGIYEGTMDGIKSNLSYLRRSKQTYVVVTGTYSVFNTTFDDMLKEHIASKADISLMYSKLTPESESDASQASQHAYLNLDDDGFVTGLDIGVNRGSHAPLSMKVILLKREWLINMVELSQLRGIHDLHRMLKEGIDNKLAVVKGYEYKGYHKRIESIKSFYDFNMDMLDSRIRNAFFGEHTIYTKVRDEVPARYLDNAKTVNSLVADGCIIDGTVEDSVLFRGVRVAKGAKVRNCILMQECDIGENVELENVIFDKSVTVSSGRLVGHSSFPIVIQKGKKL